MKNDKSLLNKTISYILRHAPWEYELELDQEGWVPIENLIIILRSENADWVNLKVIDLHNLIEESDKKRHEIHDNKIRALYGHSVPVILKKLQTPPPKILYHGTSEDAYAKIRIEGLKPMNRNYVHLSPSLEVARQVGYRKSKIPYILQIDAIEASRQGAKFYFGNEFVWLSDFIPPEFITKN